MKIIVNGHTYFPDKILKVGRIEQNNHYYFYEFIMKLGDKTVTEMSCSSSKSDLERLVNEREWILDYTIKEGSDIDLDSKHKKDS